MEQENEVRLSLGLESLELSFETGTPLLISTLDVSNLAFLEEGLGVLQVAGHVINQIRLLLGTQKTVQVARLDKVLIRESDDVAGSNGIDIEGGVGVGDSSLLSTSEGVGLVVGSRTTVAVDGHETIALLVGNASIVGNVNGDLLVVGAETVAVGIGVREETSLKHTIS